MKTELLVDESFTCCYNVKASQQLQVNMARSPSGKAPVCNTVITGSNPVRASIRSIEYYFDAFF